MVATLVKTVADHYDELVKTAARAEQARAAAAGASESSAAPSTSNVAASERPSKRKNKGGVLPA
eukprot:4960711-Pleurochrysis_carterae.AAC.1